MTDSTERSLLEARVRATNYMREWWSHCDKVEREHKTGIGWLADHVLDGAGVPDLLVIREAAQAFVDAALNPFDTGEQEFARLREVLRS